MPQTLLQTWESDYDAGGMSVAAGTPNLNPSESRTTNPLPRSVVSVYSSDKRRSDQRAGHDFSAWSVLHSYRVYEALLIQVVCDIQLHRRDGRLSVIIIDALGPRDVGIGGGMRLTSLSER